MSVASERLEEAAKPPSFHAENTSWPAFEMDVVPAGSLPLLALPSGEAPRIYRKRQNELNEHQEEALRAQLRQHIGVSLYASRSATPSRGEARANPHSSSSDLLNEGDGAPIDGGSPFSAFWPGSASDSGSPLMEIRKAVHRFFRFADQDMAEEIDDGDPKIQAGKKFLAGIEEFATLSEHELAQLVSVSELRAYDAGDIILADERAADGLYIVLSGSAGRFPATNGSLDAVSPIESFGYQEHFGVPVVDASAKVGDESVILATADTVECVWLPELVVRMLNLQPRMDFEFVLVLHNHRGGEFQDGQEKIVLNLLRAGIHVTVLANTRNTLNCIILLLSAPLWLLAREDKLMTMERIIENHAEEDTRNVGDDYEYHGETMTASDRIAAFASILTRSPTDKPPGAGLRGIEGNQDRVVRDVFPLHDPSITDFILTSWSRGEGNHTATYKRLFLLRLKDYFGLRIAFYMAFVRLYNSALVYPSNAGILLWIFLRWIHYRWYLKVMGIYGLCIAFIWAPSFLRRWGRYQNSLLVEWNLLGTKEVPQQNSEFRDYVVETINVADEGEPPDYVEVKTYDTRRRWPKYAIFTVFCFVCLVLLFLLVGIYVQWYIIAVMTPMCTDPRCPEFLDVKGGCEAHCAELFGHGKSYLFMKSITSCSEYCDVTKFDRSYYRCDAALIGCFATERGIVGTARWFYVLVQGIVLGLTLDIVFLAIFETIALAFNRWENYQTDQESETRCIQKIFLFNWVGYFYWFFLLAFVYVPNGADVQEAIRTRIDNSWVFTLDYNFRFSRYWVDGLISMDSAFVTPMIVTQALNLLINTFVPYLLRRAIIRARDSYHVKKERLSTVLKKSKTARGKSAAQSKTPNDSNQLERSEATGSFSNANPLEASDSEYNTFNDVEQWVTLTDGVDRQELSKMLAEREPIAARKLDSAVRDLFSSISSHDHHMSDICGELTRDDLDEFQLTSYDWVDRIARSIEETGVLRGFWDTATASMESTGNTRGESDSHDGNAGDERHASRALKLRLVTNWQCRNYNYTADRIMEESSMGVYSPFGDLLHLAIQFSYTIMFSVVWPFCCFCSFARNTIALRFDAIKMTIDCKRPVPRRTVGIGPWLNAFIFEIFVAQVIVPALFVYVSGQLDAFFDECKISDELYGPGVCLSQAQRLTSFCSLENVGIAVCFVVYFMKSDISSETAIKVVAHTRKLRHNLRKSVRMIGESILVSVSPAQPNTLPGSAPTASYLTASNSTARNRAETEKNLLATQDEEKLDDDDVVGDPNFLFSVDLAVAPITPAGGGSPGSSSRDSNELRHRRSTASGTLSKPRIPGTTSESALSIEWREGTVSWVKNGRIKVNFSGGRKLNEEGAGMGTRADTLGGEVWLASHERHVLMDPTPVKIFEVGMPVLLASRKFGRWLEATVVGVDSRDRLGKPVRPSPNEMHLRVVEAQNLRSTRGGGSVDPYCVVTAHVGGSQQFRHATSIKRRAVSPVWDEQLVFPLLAADLLASSPAETAGAGSSNSAAAVTPLPPLNVATTTEVTGDRTVKVVVYNNDPFARLERLGEVEVDVAQFRDGRRHRALLPLAQSKRHVWTLEAVQRLAHRQALGGADYPLLGMPHLLLELQWIDTRLPTRVSVRVKGQRQSVELSRRFCETNLCYGIRPDMISSQPKFHIA